MKLAIIGFGREGKSLLEFLRKEPRFQNAEIWVCDKNPKTVSSIRYQVSGIRTGKDYLKNLGDFDIVFRSPGVPYTLPEIQEAKKAGVELSSPTRLFFEFARRQTSNIIGITGTKGKGTTSTLLYQILKAAGEDVHLGGNIGLPATELLPKLKKNSIVILELSSFQLQDLDCSPHISVILEVFPDHQEDIKTAEHGTHRSLREYYDSKANIVKYQSGTDLAFFFANQKNSRSIGLLGKAEKIAVDPEKFKEFDPTELKIRGAHNFQNAAMAAMVAESLGVPKKVIARVVKNFRGLEHRSELVRKIGNVSFYNDSASTNPRTSSVAIRAFAGEPFSVILGGYDKGLDYVSVAKAIRKSKPYLVLLMGANSPKIYMAIRRTGAKIKFVKDLRSAVRTAYSELTARRPSSTVGSSVVFSPGAASFDMFKNYTDRGRQFKKLVAEL